MTLSPLTENGWALKNDDISVVWDTDDNLKRVQDTIQWYTKGCSCKSGCTTNRCSCKRQSDRQGRKMGGYCALIFCIRVKCLSSLSSHSMLSYTSLADVAC
jgi:hypothetical protein